MDYVIGADVGTTRIKCILYAQSGAPVASASREYPCYHEQAGRSEQNAGDWWQALCAAVREVAGQVERPGRVRALCLATQGGTLVPVDGQYAPLTRAIVWNDSRCGAERAELLTRVDAHGVWEKTGWTLGSGLNALQILWLKRQRPELFARTHKFLSVPDYLAYRLTGVCAIDPSNAGINQLADIGRNQWDEALLAAVGIRAEQLSPIVESGEVIAPLTPEAARALGLSEQTLLVAGGHDQYCCALGAGAIHNGDLLVATGTCWVAASISERRPARYCVSRHTIRPLWGALLSHPSGGESLEWFRSLLSWDAKLSYDLLNDALAPTSPGANGARFFPFLSGGATFPAESAAARGAFLGLSASHSRGDLARAIMEGVCYQVAWMLSSFEAGRDSALIMTGGATNSSIWVDIFANVLNRPVHIPPVADVGCMGAAILAGCASGLFSTVEQGVRLVGGGGCVVLPSAAPSQAYRALFAQYRRDQPRLLALSQDAL